AAETGYHAALDIEPRHSGALTGLGRIRESEGQPDEALHQFRASLDIDSANFDAVCGIARALGQQGKTEDAVGYIRRAIQADPALSQAQNEMFAALKAGQEKQIPVWHFSMLADRERNNAYQRAIEKLIAPSSRVLDIGTGSGLLALMAARVGAERITACEISKPVAEAARKVVAENGYGGVIDVVAKSSTALRIGEDMAQRATVLVSEILDSGLTGEGVVKFVRHAQRELLTPDARILPAAADVKAVLVALPRLRPVNPVAEISGFDLSGFGRFQTLHDYQSIDLKREPCERLTETFDAISFDFRNLPPEASTERPLKKTIDVEIAADGQFHAIAFWFDLHLDDEIMVSSGPEGDVVHWGQAVQFFADDLAVQRGDTVRLKLYFDEIKIRWKIDRIVSR
ncbi:MAG: methyltransferase domain-containing protein, partial [Alphaproteobacteria bacterium]|nr:methyltransferase domain-containing protein [Alphaproteobacteria bacterium]